MLSTDDQRNIEDLAQEGWIAIWREIPNNSNQAWLIAVAKNCMMNVIRNDHAQKRDSRRRVLVENIAEYWDGEAASHDVEWAYHHGEINAALDVLSPQQKEYVRLRFWCSYDYHDLNEYFGFPTQAIWTRARSKLVKELAHLGVE